MTAQEGAAARRGGGDLGAALRRWRDRVAPADVGLPAGRPRRAAGLRREEVARLAGISVDYVVRLEQGRASSPSAQVLTALARALRLSDEERHHLFLLAGRLAPAGDRGSAHLTPSVVRLLERMADSAVGVFDPAWTLVAANPVYTALAGEYSGAAGRDRNLLWRHFTGMPSGVVHTPEQADRFERAAVADLRSATARRPGDPRLRRLVADLRRHSPRFADLWAAHAVGTHAADTKTLHHPEVGALERDCDVPTVPGSDARVVVHTAAPGSESAAKLRLLGAAGARGAGAHRHR
ncbi:helix-turn-helix domain-containing protein [Streptomonospora nanhaiensis]|uniref:helix-turn-helix domain-containing protein n=1 Tax=Streptomonospora nanhaiensis TaxID=1323731 RepID=UPI001C3910A6|nr:helix-turn-helix transcriptional regulator [Streptomonospora nanhaiensis]MBV2366482.1 helix-turn-helix transcriptional regulator [Streptomonospora nanhaiensis]